MRTYESYKSALKDIPYPCALLDYDIFTQNINDIASSSNHKQIRIATKSIRSVSVLKDIEASSPAFEGFMCLTL